ncbi:MAG: WD40 repeat domain-containing protein, partial [Xanthobacteraceae bacterium]|nr:WD40 repeat domain-containing protein [Xanthobacteraceae bacterium]
MSDFNPAPDSASIVSVTDRIRKVELKAPAAFVHFLGDVAAFVGAEEHVMLVDEDGAWTQLGVHEGGILCTATDGKRVVSGGDDGKLVSVNAKGETETLATDAKRRWIDNVAAHADGTVAWSAGKTAFARASKGEEKSIEVSSTVGGLAFAPKGLRLAIAHYNGVTLW